MKYFAILFILTFLASCSQKTTKDTQQIDSKPNRETAEQKELRFWKDSSQKSILKSLTKINDTNKIITFDLDGTIISESPNYYMVDLLKKYDAINGNDMNSLISGLTQFMNKPDYKTLVKTFVRENPPKIYAPMKELLVFLKNKGYTIVLCTGSPVELAEAIQEEYLPQVDIVIGSQVINDSINVNDKEGKVANLKANNLRPAIVFGNSTGDFAMMKYSTANNYLIIHDDQDLKEFDRPDFYTEECKKLDIQTISIKNDWKQVFD